MKYLLLIYHDEQIDQQRTMQEGQAVMQAYWQFGHDLQTRGIDHSGDALHPSATAATLRVRDDEPLITDGPFAETKEQLGGYYIVDVNDMQTALAVAAKIPGAREGAIEIRPIIDFSETSQ